MWYLIKIVAVLNKARTSFELTHTYICIELERDHEKDQLSLSCATADPDSISRSATTNKREARAIIPTDWQNRS